MNNKVVLVGVLNIKGSTNIAQSIAFLKTGYEVIPINYRTIISKYGIEYFFKYLIYNIKKNDPKLTLFSKCNGVDPQVTEECTKLGTTWLWNMDAEDTIKHVPEVIGHARNCTYSSCTSPTTVKWFESKGVKNCYHIFEGIDTSVIKPVEFCKEYKADISFIGTRTDLRDEYIEFLRDNGFKVNAYGSGYSKSVINGEFAKVCSSSKFMLSLNTHNNVPEYFSDRLFRYLGCKTCTFHLDTTGTLNKYFEDGKDIIYFESKEDLLNKLNIISDKQINLIKESGYKKVINNYTWDHSINKILEIIK